tara:strand:- start:265 stop:405 length:141 start_codon:yes stop_codon:yes gene_type:complete
MGRPKGSKNKKRKGYTNIPNNFRGSEDIFWSKVVKGVRNFLQSPFK